MTAGSVLIHLPEGMTIVLLHHSPSDMTKKHFILHNEHSDNPSDDSHVLVTALSVVFAVMFVALCGFLVIRRVNTKTTAVAPDSLFHDVESRGHAVPLNFHSIGDERIAEERSERMCSGTAVAPMVEENGDKNSVSN